MMSFLAVRDRQPELMDDPDLDPELHGQALAGLRRVHAISGTVSTLWTPIHQLAKQKSGQTLRVLDVACGGGDLAISLAKRAAKVRVPMEISGCDISQTALDFASANATAQSAKVNFFQADAIASSLPDSFDVVCCSLFLHHLDEEAAVQLLTSMKRTARRLVLISDLSRSRLGYLLTWCGLRLLSRSRICHVDGPLSVKAAFTPQEAMAIAEKAGLSGVVLTRHWPERFLLTWTRS